MDNAQSLFESVHAIKERCDEILALNDGAALSQTDTTAIKEGLVGIQGDLQTAFPVLKTIRRDVFALQPAAQVA